MEVKSELGFVSEPPPSCTIAFKNRQLLIALNESLFNQTKHTRERKLQTKTTIFMFVLSDNKRTGLR